MKIFDKINILLIYKKHIETFYNYGQANASGIKKATYKDKITFIYFPFLIAILSCATGVKITNNYVNIVITSLSIFVGLLFNLLILIFDLAKKQKAHIEDLKTREEIVSQKEQAKYLLIKEVFVNISFAIVLSILSIVAILLPNLKPLTIINYLHNWMYYYILRQFYVSVTSTFAIFLIFEFILVLLMILKRFFLIFNNEIAN